MRKNRLTAWALSLVAAVGIMLSSCTQKEEQLEGFHIKRGTNLRDRGLIDILMK